MIISSRKAIQALFRADGNNGNIKPPRGEHAGLLLSHYLAAQCEENDNNELKSQLREVLLLQAIEACQIATPLAKEAFNLWQASLDLLDPLPFIGGYFKTQGRLVIGLGSENVLETGLTLHHTYGIPILPGSALKGLAAHYCASVWGVQDEAFSKTGQSYNEIFGDTEDAGHITFYDAWWIPENNNDSLMLDVMTPHHQEYYSNKGYTPPTDFDDPTPVLFLSVSGTFNITVAGDVPGEDGKKWVHLAFNLITKALKNWGIGGKTNAGYGRLMEEPVN